MNQNAYQELEDIYRAESLPENSFRRTPLYQELDRGFEEARRVQGALTVTQNVQPDRAAELNRLSQMTGLPRPVVETAEGEAKARAMFQQINELSQSSPTLRRRLTDPKFTEIAKDDVGVLAKIEQGVGATTRYILGADGEGGLPADLRRGVFNRGSAATAGVFRAAAETLAVPFDFLEEFTSIGGNPMRRLAEGFQQIQDGQNRLASGGSQVFGVSAGVQSLGQNAKYLPLIAFGPAGGAAALVGMTAEAFGQGYGEARDGGLSPFGALAYGGSQAAIEFATERMPIGALMGDLAKGAGLGRMLARQLALEIPGEQAATVLQDLNQWAAIESNQGKTFRDYLNERPSAALETAIATVIGSGGNVLLLKGADKLMDGYLQRTFEQQSTTEQFQSIQQLMGLAVQSKLRERDPEAFRAAMDDMLQSQGPESTKMFVDGEILNQVSAETRAALGITDEQLQDALTSGTALEVPLSGILAQTAGTPDGELLTQHLRASPTTMSPAEAMAAQDRANQWLQQNMERYVAAAPDVVAAAAEVEQIKADITAQLDAATPQFKGANPFLAESFAAGIAAMARRLGKTASQVYAENRATIVPGGQQQSDALTQLPNGGQAVQSTYTDREGRNYDVRLEPRVYGMGNDRQLALRAVVADPGTNAFRGYVDFALDGNTLRGENLVVAPGSRGRGLAEAMYRAARAAGYDIAPGRVQTPEGDAFVRMMQARGVINAPADDTGVLNQTPGALPGWSLEKAKGARITDAVKKGAIALAPKASLARKNYDKLDAIFAKVPDPLASEEAWRKFMSLLVADSNVLGVPYNALKYAQSPQAVAEYLSRLRPDQLESRRAGFELGAKIRASYAAGEANPVTTGRLLLWAMLSRKAGAYPHEAAYMDLVNGGVDQWIEKAVNGTWTEADGDAYVKWSSEFMATKKGGASPSAGVTSNANDFGRILLSKMSEKDESGTTQLTRLHNMIADQNVSTDQVRREFFALGDSLGIQNKVLSFALLVTGRWDTLVLDRMQFTHLWGDTYRERAGQRNIYDQGLSTAGEGHFGLAVYEALSRGMSESIRQGYALAGLNDLGDGTLGAFHWDSWLIESSQAIGHPTIEALDTERPRPDLAVRQGKFDTYAYNFEYRADGQYQIPLLGGGGYIILSPAEASAFQSRISDPKEGVVPKDFKVSQNKASPWVDAEGVNRGRYNAILSEYGRRADAADVAPAGLADAGGSFQQRAADAGRSDAGGATATPVGGVNGRPEQTRDGVGGYSAGGLAPLEGAPTVAGAAGPDPRLVAVAESYAASIGVDLRRPAEFVEVDPERAARIAAAYEAMPHAPQDPAVQEAYQNLIAQTVAQYRALEAAGYRFYFFDEGNDPYGGNPWNAMRDLRANQTMGVFATEAGFGSGATDLDVANNPLLADTGITWPWGSLDGEPKRVLANDLFRAVHDAFGHGLEGAGFRARGEENAWQAHVRLFTGSAVGAITSETRGQNSWLNYGPYGETNRTAGVADTVFADQKTGLMPEWTWTEGRAADMDDGTQREQRRLRQDVDLSILQQSADGTLAQAAPLVDQTETPSFKAWFGDSKVVDAEGRPLVVYHGGARGITEFDPGAVGSNFGFDSEGFFFTTERGNRPGTADNYAGPDGEVYPVYLSLQRPYTLQQFASDLGLTVDDLVVQEGSPQSPITVFDTDRAEIMRRVRDGGYDGVVFDVDYGDGTREAMYVALQPTQIKSAISNNGRFDATDPGIFRQEAKPGEVSVTGLHFSRQRRTSLNGAFYGTGLRGAERDRVFNGDDQRLRSRVYFYVDEGRGVVPEAGVGGAAHSAELSNLYDINADPLKLAAQGGGVNAIESRILDAGFDGYYRASFANNAGVAVVIGPAARSIAVTPIEEPNIGRGEYIAPEPTVRVTLTPQQVAALDENALRAAAPNAQLERSFIAVRPSTVTLRESELDSARQLMADLGVELPAARQVLAVAQGNEQTTVRGTYRPSTMQIALNPSADLSTFIHESGHFFLDMLMRYGSDANAPADVQADAAAVLKWFGVKDVATWNSLSLKEKAPYHERWAESFEQYKFEGKAPTPELRPAFRKFSAFLKEVYGSVKGLLRTAQARGSDMSIALNDEIRGVMDRILGADAAVREAEDRLGGPVSEEATDQALETLEARSLRNMKWLANARSKYIKKLQAEAKETRAKVREEVAAEVNTMPVVMARKALDALAVVPEHKVALDQHREARKAAQKQLEGEVREFFLEREATQNGARPAGLQLGTFLSKNKREITNEVERRMIDWDRQNPRPLRPVNATDQDMATVADSFGFPDVAAMMQAIQDFGQTNEVIDAMTDQRMLEEYGDLVDPRSMEAAADEALHNEIRTRTLAAEVAAERDAMNPRGDTGRTTKSGAKVTTNVLLEAARKYAEQVVARTLVNDLRSRRAAHNAAERKAANAYNEARKGGDAKAAIEAHQQQLLNTTVSKHMSEAITEAQKMVEFLRKTLADSNERLVEKGRDPDVVNAMRAVLADFGIGGRTAKSAREYLETVARNDPETAATLTEMLEPLRDFVQPINALSFGQLKELHDAMQAMWFLSKQMRQMEVGGDKIDVQDAADELRADLEKVGVPIEALGDRGSLTDKEKLVSNVRFLRAALTRVEQWADAYGPAFTKYIFRPVKEAADRYRADRVKYRKAYIELLQNIAPALKDGQIVAPELNGFVFGRGKVRGHAELLHAILHTGNDSNKRKLLLGRGWATENQDGTLDTTQWDAFVKRMQDTGYLRKEHYDFAQRVWNLLEEIKPLAQKAHREVYGRYFDEVTANSFETPFGTYKGGYVPAQAALESSKDADRAALNEQNESMITAFPSAPRGFTKSRVDYNTKLTLDLASLGSHIDQVLRFSYMQPAVRGVTRLLKNNTFSGAMSKVDNAVTTGLLLPFLQRAARQSAETPVLADGGSMRLISIVRGRAGMALMMGNLMNAVQQTTGFLNAAAKVRPALLLQSAAKMIANPKAFNATVRETSIFMRDRMENEISAINEAMEEVLLDPTLLKSAQAWTNKHAYFLQAVFDNTMSPIVWTAAYNQAIERGASHDDAAFEADGVVRTTQTSTLPEDISRAESGSPLIRLFTQFANYFNMLANTYLADLVKLSRDGGLANNKARALYLTFTGLLLPIWVAEGIALAFRGGPADEDEDGYYWDDWVSNVMGLGTVRSLFAAVPGVGQIAVAAVNRFNDNPMDDRASLSPVVSLLETAAGLPYKGWRLVTGEDVQLRTVVNDAATAISVGLGLPARPLARPISYLTGVANDEIEPAGPLDFARGLITGTPSEESKSQ